MKPRSLHLARWACALTLATITLDLLHPSVSGQTPVIQSFGQNGELTGTNLMPGSVAAVEWAPTVNGPWTNTWAGLKAITVDSNGTIRVQVPMFYRVRGERADMALIPAGEFQMGDTFGEGYSDVLPVHTVHVSAFYMDRTEVTKAQWDAVYQWAIGHGYSFDNPGSWYGGVNYSKGDNHPVHTISWYDAVKWCNARSEREGRPWAYYTDQGLSQPYRTGRVSPSVRWDRGYRLPTEAEWEKAARGGSSGNRFPWGDTISHSQANYYSYWESGHHLYVYDLAATEGYHPNYATGVEPYTSPVGPFAANGYGLYDMAGNVWEWCWDWYSSSYYSSSSGSDPRGPGSGSYRAIRGGGWNSLAWHCRAANRNDSFYPDYRFYYLGFRTVLPPGQP
ncbi:MAG: formylglycine-generating enzyme family protein [Verrucomicrobia bacterium]|nr:formylglycine-generating enzyme family protein [Verrucomicrobiota bacterium]